MEAAYYDTEAPDHDPDHDPEASYNDTQAPYDDPYAYQTHYDPHTVRI